MAAGQMWAAFSDEDVTLPSPDSQVDRECCSVSSFDTALSPGGLYICLKTHQSYGKQFLTAASSGRYYVHLQDRYVRKPPEEDDNLKISASGAMTCSMAVSNFCKLRRVCVWDRADDCSVELCTDLDHTPLTVGSLVDMGIPETLARVVTAVLNHTNRAVPTGWEEPLQESVFAADLQQCPEPAKIPQRGWQCSDCGARSNLWMNLSTGYIGCGRKLYGVETSGCQNGKEGAAVRHFEEDKQGRPLAVKLGTITPSGADVFSYPEDEMVVDPRLGEHLLHFGIDISRMERTEATVADAQVALNKDFDWSGGKGVEEQGQCLREVGFVGLENLGNTCYMNVTLQLLARATRHSGSLLPQESELSRAIAALLGERYHRQRQLLDQELGNEAENFAAEHPCVCICPRRFRQMVASRSKEFAQSKQQDADEFLRWLLDTMHISVDFPVEQQLKRLEDGAVRVQESEERVLTLFVPHPPLEGNDEPEMKRSKLTGISWAELFEGWMAPESVTSWEKRGNERVKVQCELSRKIKDFPPHLFMQVGRFYVDDSWAPKKNTVPIDMPEMIDLTPFRATGCPLNTPIWPDEEDPMVEVLLGMGYSAVLATAAAKHVDKENPDRLSAALDWCNAHMGDTPQQLQQQQKTNSRKEPDQASMEMLMAMGFEQLQATVALLQNEHDVTAATDWLLSVGGALEEPQLLEILDALTSPKTTTGGNKALQCTDNGKYKLVGFASHNGGNCHSGHYVCYIRRADGSWVRINDERCMAVKDVPKQEGYLYLYSREDVEPWETLIEVASQKFPS